MKTFRIILITALTSLSNLSAIEELTLEQFVATKLILEAGGEYNKEAMQAVYEVILKRAEKRRLTAKQVSCWNSGRIDALLGKAKRHPRWHEAIATDTYGDRLVYDESNNLYVNDEDAPLMKDGVNLKTDAYPGWNFYAIESTDYGYICILKNNTRIYEQTFDPDGNYISGSSVVNLSYYVSLLGQSLN